MLGETELHEGDKVIMFYNSANRDEDVFDDPYTFDVRRDPNPHIGFGAAGPHFCLGAHLARQEIDVMFRRLFERLPDIEAVGEPDRLLSPFINGIKHLDCTFTPVAGALKLGTPAPLALTSPEYSWKAARARGPTPVPGPPFMEMATPIISATSSMVAPGRARPRAWAAMHPSHSRVMEMARAISSLVLAVERALGHGRAAERAVAGHDIGDGLA